MDSIQISLKAAEWNLVLNALAHRPYGEVAEVVAKIAAQANPQPAPPAPAAE